MNVTFEKKEIVVMVLYILMILCMTSAAYEVLVTEKYATSVESMHADGADVTSLVNLFVWIINGMLKIIFAVIIMLVNLVISIIVSLVIRKKVLCTAQDFQVSKKIGKIILITAAIGILIDFIMCGVNGIIWSFLILLPIPVFYYWLVVRYLKKKDTVYMR